MLEGHHFQSEPCIWAPGLKRKKGKEPEYRTGFLPAMTLGDLGLKLQNQEELDPQDRNDLHGSK